MCLQKKMDEFIDRKTLDALSYRSSLGQSLKQISLRKTPLHLILQDIERYRESYIDTLIQENLIGSRFKSEDSIMRKYENRAIHLYYQRDSWSYPIEIQLWCGRDYLFNTWSHQYIYKYRSPEVGRRLYAAYLAGKITSEEDFRHSIENEVI